MGLSRKSKSKFNKIRSVVFLDKLLHKEEYIDNNGQIIEMFKVEKENIIYSVINFKSSDNEYLVYINININEKFALQQLLKTFKDFDNSLDYYESLCIIVNCMENNEIINKCYEELTLFPRKNFITKLLNL